MIHKRQTRTPLAICNLLQTKLLAMISRFPTVPVIGLDCTVAWPYNEGKGHSMRNPFPYLSLNHVYVLHLTTEKCHELTQTMKYVTRLAPPLIPPKNTSDTQSNKCYKPLYKIIANTQYQDSLFITPEISNIPMPN